MLQVADELGIDLTTFSRQVKTLEGKQLVVRQVSTEDRRVNLLRLTGEGEQVLARIDQYMAEKIEQIFAFMSPFERDSVVRSLDLLNSAIIKATSCCPAPANKIAFCK
jgi:DNA-binding MarR family transcriptional regulator